MRIDFVIDIKSDVETVFSWIAGPEKAMTWMTSVAGGEIIDQKPGMVGTTFRERVEDAEGGVDMEGTITAFEPNRRIGFHLESRVNRVNVDYRVQAIEGGTRLSYTANVRWRFPVNVIALFASRTMKRKIAEQSSQEFARLKELCETPDAAAQARPPS
jgi:uncharacterized protein YndB with AHSA1/START domain